MGAYNGLDTAVAGLLSGDGHQKISRLATTAIPFGSAVYLPVNDGDTCNATHVAAKVPDGVAFFTQKFPGSYEAQDSVNIARTGLVWVPVSSAVQANNALYITPAGVWTDVTTSNTACKGKFRSSTSGAGLALVELFDN